MPGAQLTPRSPAGHVAEGKADSRAFLGPWLTHAWSAVRKHEQRSLPPPPEPGLGPRLRAATLDRAWASLLSQRGFRDRVCGRQKQTVNLLWGLLGEGLLQGGRRRLGVTLGAVRWSPELKAGLGRMGLDPQGPRPLFPSPSHTGNVWAAALGLGPFNRLPDVHRPSSPPVTSTVTERSSLSPGGGTTRMVSVCSALSQLTRLLRHGLVPWI